LVHSRFDNQLGCLGPRAKGISRTQQRIGELYCFY
jgi:hypothetical protein